VSVFEDELSSHRLTSDDEHLRVNTLLSGKLGGGGGAAALFD